MTYSSPQTLYEALAIMRDETEIGDSAHTGYIAGGTDLIPRQSIGKANSTLVHLIDISHIESLHTIELNGEYLMIGAAVQLAKLAMNDLIQTQFPTIAKAVLAIASPSIRESATIGGNLLCENRCIYFDQSDFWRAATGGCLKSGADVCVATGSTKHCYSIFISDLAPVLIALEAEVELFDENGSRWIFIPDLYSGDGLHSHRIPKNVLLARIKIPATTGGSMFFEKIRPRESVDFTSLTIAMRRVKQKVLIAASGVGPAPAFASHDLPVDAATLFRQLFSKTKIIDNGAYQREYRKEMISTVLDRGLKCM